MPAKKKTKIKKEKVIEEIGELSEILLAKVKQAKNKYHQLDEDDKKKLWAVGAGALALLAGIGASAGYKKKKGKK